MSRVVAGGPSRADSPAPKTSAPKPAAAKPEEVSKAEAAAAASAKAESQKEILGVHPQVFYAVVIAPICVFLVFALAAGPGRGYVQTGVSLIIAKWNTVSDPIEKFLIERADVIMILAAMTTFAPVLYLGLVTLLRAFGDLQHFTTLQQLIFSALTLGSIASFVITTKGRLWTPTSVLDAWDAFTNPMEKVLTDYADHFVAGAAMLAWAPLLYCVLATVLRSVWNCRIKLVVEQEEPATSTKKSN